MSTPGVPCCREIAATCLLVMVAGLLSTPPPPAAASTGADEALHLRLRAVEGSGLAELSQPLARTLHRGPEGERRTRRLATSGHAMAALTWRGPAPDVRVRSHGPDGWGDWVDADPLTDLPDALEAPDGAVRGSHPLWFGPSDGVQVAVRGLAPDGLSLVLLDPRPRPVTASRLDQGHTARRVEHARTRVGSSGVPRPTLRSRDDWGADESWRNGSPRYNDKLKQVHVHHTVTGNAYSRADVPGLIRGMYRYHTHNLGWSDLGYNFLVDRFGRTWVGRAGGPGRLVRGAHTLGFNHSSTGVAVIGDLEDAHPGRDVLRAVSRIAAWKLDRAERDPRGRVRVRSQGSDRYPEGRWVRLPVIDGHRDTNDTACPGQHLYEKLRRIRRMAERRINRF